METLQRGKGLENKVTLYVPTTIDVDQPLDAETVNEVVEKVQRFLSRLFGGTTSIQAQGTWLSEEELIKEDVILVSSHVAHLDDEALQTVLRFCDDLRDELRQEALTVEINGIMHFIRGHLKED